MLTDVIKTEDFMMYCTTPKHFDSIPPRWSMRKKHTDGKLKRRWIGNKVAKLEGVRGEIKQKKWDNDTVVVGLFWIFYNDVERWMVAMIIM